MATYNGEKYIREQLDSIARQDLLPLELVITDDGSIDATLQIVDEFARAAPFPVRVFRNEIRLGFADNFLKAASLCNGDLIAFCDQDDIWMEKKLSLCSYHFGDPEVMLAVHSARIVTRSGLPGSYYLRFSVTKALDVCDPFASGPGFAMVIRRDLLYISDHYHRPCRLHSHDRWFWFLAACTGRIVRIADVLTFYRQHDNNVYGAPETHSVAELVRSIAGIIEYEGAADGELACSRMLRVAANQHPVRADRLCWAAKGLERRSRLHRLRAGIYNKEATFLRRAFEFSRIFFFGGYLPDRSSARLGLRAAAKDMLFGVPGIYKLVPRRP